MSIYKGDNLIVGTTSSAQAIMDGISKLSDKFDALDTKVNNFIDTPQVASISLATLVISAEIDYLDEVVEIKLRNAEGIYELHSRYTMDDKLVIIAPLGRLGSYQVVAKSETFNVEVKDHSTKELYLNYNDKSWLGIQRIVRAGLAQDYLSLGDKFLIDCNAFSLEVEVAGFDIYTDNTVSFIATHLLDSKYPINSIDNNGGGYQGSEAGSSLLDVTIFSALPKDLQLAIKPKSLVRRAGGSTVLIGGPTQLETTKLWMPTVTEVIGVNDYVHDDSSLDQYHHQYPIFTDAGSIQRSLGRTNVATRYWTSTPAAGPNYGNTAFGVINANGVDQTVVVCSSPEGILVCFDIG